MGQAEYNACIAAGGSPATCSIYLEEDSDTETKGGVMGQTLYDLDGNLLGKFTMGPWGPRPVRRSGQSLAAYAQSLTNWAKPIPLIAGPSGIFKFSAGSYLMDAGLGKLYHLTLDSKGNILKSATSTLSSGNGGGGAYTSTAAYQQSQQTFESAEAEKARLWQAEQNRIAAENQRRLSLQDRLTALAGEAVQARGDYRARLMALAESTNRDLAETLGADPVRAAIMMAGGAQQGLTPSQTYRARVAGMGESARRTAAGLGELRQPNLAADIAGLEAQIPYYQSAANPPDLPGLPTPSPFMGMAGGGTFAVMEGMQRMEPVMGDMQPMGQAMAPQGMGVSTRGEVPAADGIPLPTPGTSKVAVLVGEGASTHVEPGTEVAIQDRDTGQTEIVPLMGGAVAGGDLSDWSSLATDWRATEQALSPLWAYSGFKNAPLTAPSYGMGSLSRLGVRPSLVRDIQSGAIFYVDPESHKRYRVPDMGAFKRFGFQMPQVMGMSAQDIGALGPYAGVLTQAPSRVSSASLLPNPTVFAPITMPETLTGTSGRLLPSPGVNARFWAQIFGSLSPAARSVILSAYRTAGWTPDMIEELAAAFTPSGTATARGVTYG